MNNIKSIEKFRNNLGWRERLKSENKGYLLGTTRRFVSKFYCFHDYNIDKKIKNSEPLSYNIDLKLGLIIRTYKDCIVYSEIDRETNKSYIVGITVKKPEIIEIDFVNKKVIRTKTDRLKRDIIYKRRVNKKDRAKLNKFKSYSYKSEMLWEKKAA